MEPLEPWSPILEEQVKVLRPWQGPDFVTFLLHVPSARSLLHVLVTVPEDDWIASMPLENDLATLLAIEQYPSSDLERIALNVGSSHELLCLRMEVLAGSALSWCVTLEPMADAYLTPCRRPLRRDSQRYVAQHLRRSCCENLAKHLDLESDQT